MIIIIITLIIITIITLIIIITTITPIVIIITYNIQTELSGIKFDDVWHFQETFTVIWCFM